MRTDEMALNIGTPTFVWSLARLIIAGLVFLVLCPPYSPANRIRWRTWQLTRTRAQAHGAGPVSCFIDAFFSEQALVGGVAHRGEVVPLLHKPASRAR